MSDYRLLSDGVSRRLLADGTSLRLLATAPSGPATAVTFSGPTAGVTNEASTNFTVGANGSITGTVTVTPSDSGGGGAFSPTSVAISSGTPTATFTYTPGTNGTKTLVVTDDGGLTDPSSISYVASPSCTVSLTAPVLAHGLIARASDNFTASITGNHAGLTLTPSDGSGGSFSPSTVVLSTGTPSATFTYTPATSGSKTISCSTSDAAIAAPSSVAFRSDNPQFYISATGSDSNDGQSTGAPWLTAGKIASYGAFRGATYSFKGGDTFEGTIDLGDGNSGSDLADLITLNSYGTGRAILTVTTGGTSTTTPVISAADTGGVKIDNLQIVGRASGSSNARQHLINFDPTAAGSGTKYNLTVTNCVISKGKRGISCYEYRSWQSPPVVTTSVKHDGITITDNDISDCWDEGISIRRYRITVGTDHTWIVNLMISDNVVRDAGGNSNAGGIASGIVTTCCTGTIERNILHDIGTGSAYGCGGAFWCQVCVVVVRQNEIYNITGPQGDAVGIDFDTSTHDSVAEYNYIHDCEGSGLLAYQPQPEGTPTSIAWENNIWRFNVVQNCGDVARPDTFLWGQIGFIGDDFGNLKIYGNVIANTAGTGRAFMRSHAFSGTFDTARVASLEVYNNVFYSNASQTIFDFPSGSGTESGFIFKNNAIYVGGGAVSIKWFGTTYTSIAAWAAAATHGDTAAITTDPLLLDPLTAVVYDDPVAMLAFDNVTPQSGSPLFTAGLDLNAAPYSYGLNKDFQGAWIPISGVMDIGAIQTDGLAVSNAGQRTARRAQSGINFFGSRR